MPDARARRPADPGVGRALVVGARVTGQAVAAALRRADVGVVVTDTDIELLAGLPEDVEALAVADPRPLLPRVDVVVPSPGVPETSSLLRAAEAAGIPVWSEPELAQRLFPRPLLGVTGTNGKTTVTELATAMCVAGGVPALACGNIGTPLVEASAVGDALLVAELSSFQLRYVERLRARVGVLLNIAPDHLDWHGGLGPYRAAKARLWAGQHEEDWAVVDPAQPDPAALVAAAPGRRATFSGASASGATGVGVEGEHLVLRRDGERVVLVGLDEVVADAPHHRANLAAAATVALLAGAAPHGVAEAARAFRPGAHRHQPVAVVDGVTWVDDSKATNPHAAAAALAAPVPGGRTVWLAGGQAKGVDLAPLGESLEGVRHAVLLGEAAQELVDVVTRGGVPHTVVAPGEPDPMGAAVAAAHAVARTGDRVLLSPACASFDLFTGYADRGKRFAAAARALPGAEAVRGAR